MSTVLYAPQSKYEIPKDEVAGKPFRCAICGTVAAFTADEIREPNTAAGALVADCPTCQSVVILNRHSRDTALETLRALHGINQSPAGVPPEQQP